MYLYFYLYLYLYSKSEMLQRQVQEAHERLDESSKVIVSNQEVNSISHSSNNVLNWQNATRSDI